MHSNPNALTAQALQYIADSPTDFLMLAEDHVGPEAIEWTTSQIRQMGREAWITAAAPSAKGGAL